MRTNMPVTNVEYIFKDTETLVSKTDLSGNITYVNQDFCNISGFSEEELIGSPQNILRHPDMPAEAFADFWRAYRRWLGEILTSLSAFNIAGWIFSIIAAALGLVFFWRRQRMPERLVISHERARDTEGNTLNASEARLQAIFDASPDPMVICTADGVIFMANKQVEQLLGYAVGELVGQPIDCLVPDRFHSAHSMYRASFAASPVARRMGTGRQIVARRKDGSECHVEISLNQIESNQEKFFACALRDITEIKRIEVQLIAREMQLRAIIDAEPECVEMVSSTFTLLHMNLAGLAMIEADSLEQVVGKSILGFIRPEYHAQYIERHQRLINAGDPMQMEFEILGLKGTRRWLETHAVQTYEDGEKVHLAVTIDITERKRITQNEQFRSRILELLTGNNSLHDILDAIVRGVEKLNPEIRCSIALLDKEKKHLINTVAPSLPHFYISTIDGIEIGMGVGSCGTAAFTGTRVIVDAIATHPYWAAYIDLAARAELGACWSLPIYSSLGDVLGTLAMYHRHPHHPSDADIFFIENSAKLASIAIERKQTEDELHIAAIAFESQDSMTITDAKGIIVRVNQAFIDSTSYTAEDAIGQTHSLLRSDRHEDSFYYAMWETLIKTDAWQGEIWARRKEGDVYPTWLTIAAVKNNEGVVTHYVGTHHDMTQLKMSERRIQELAFFDPLTHLPNRTLLMDRLQQALISRKQSGHHGALLFIDVDHFKTLNDTRGHDAGDLLLIELAQRLRAMLREGDTVARQGGDELVVLLVDLGTTVNEAASLAKLLGEKIQERIGIPFDLNGYEYHCTVSIGASLFDGQDSVEELFKHADLALYQAKDAGRNLLRFFDPVMRVALDLRSALEAELRIALKLKQFHLVYQPQIDITRGVVGVEALLRWQHPERGLVSQNDFIPLAEDTGMILPIGLWVLEAACAQIKAWDTDVLTRGLTIAVNVSARQFRQIDFVDQVMTVLESSGANPSCLKLELTESLVMEDVDGTILKMLKLKQFGLSFSMDDFGTGYSSLSYLAKLPIEQLKIDRSFVSNLPGKASDETITRAIIALGKGMNLNVIAEGVETESQQKFLEMHGCHIFQGYLFSRPLSIDELDLFLH